MDYATETEIVLLVYQSHKQDLTHKTWNCLFPLKNLFSCVFINFKILVLIYHFFLYCRIIVDEVVSQNFSMNHKGHPHLSTTEGGSTLHPPPLRFPLIETKNRFYVFISSFWKIRQFFKIFVVRAKTRIDKNTRLYAFVQKTWQNLIYDYFTDAFCPVQVSDQ